MELFNDKNIKPMLLSETYKPFNNSNYLYEIKFDGIRAIIYISEKELIIKSRNGANLTNKFPELQNIKKNINKKCIFDGEVVLMYDNKPSFAKLQERILLKNKFKIKNSQETNPVTFVCFDILYENQSLIDIPLIKRKKILSKYNDTEYFVKSRTVDTDGIKLFNLIKKQDLEGIVAKNKKSLYIPNTRTKEWIKIKNLKEEDFYICGYKEEENTLSLLLGKKTKKDLEYISKVTMGKKRKDYNLIKACPKTKNNFTNFKEEDYTYIKPIYKCTIKYLEKTKNNHLRHPIFKGIRID